MKKTQNTYFAEEIWHQIYPHFPLNCIFKFKCVSKVWKSDLSSPNCIHKWIQLNKSTDIPWTLAYNFENNERYYSIAHLDSHSQCITRDFLFRFIRPDCYSTRLIGSSNGLVLFSKEEGKFMQRFYYVCNPLTKQMVSLPEPHTFGKTIGGLICECSSMSTSYKVVLASFILLSPTIDIKVFSSDSGKWRTFEVSFPPDVSLEMPTKHFILQGQVLFWIDEKRRVIAYNLENIETTGVCQCKLMELPDFPLTEMCTHCLGESEGLILYARVNMCQGTVSVWVAEEEGFRLLHDDIELDNLLEKLIPDFVVRQKNTLIVVA